MADPISIPQTVTTIESGFKLAPNTMDEFWRAEESMIPVGARQPGFIAVMGGPIANSSWIYFSSKFDSPDDMDAWYKNSEHRPYMRKAYATWFESMYTYKWRLPAEGETLTGPLFCETAIVPEAALDESVVKSTLEALNVALAVNKSLPFETLDGVFEDQPFQFIGPLDEFPVVAPVRYLLNTHWATSEELELWLASSEFAALSELGAVSSQVNVQFRHAPGERPSLSADGSRKVWVRPSARSRTTA